MSYRIISQSLFLLNLWSLVGHALGKETITPMASYQLPLEGKTLKVDYIRPHLWEEYLALSFTAPVSTPTMKVDLPMMGIKAQVRHLEAFALERELILLLVEYDSGLTGIKPARNFREIQLLAWLCAPTSVSNCDWKALDVLQERLQLFPGKVIERERFYKIYPHGAHRYLLTVSSDDGKKGRGYLIQTTGPSVKKVTEQLTGMQGSLK